MLLKIVLTAFMLLMVAASDLAAQTPFDLSFPSSTVKTSKSLPVLVQNTSGRKIYYAVWLEMKADTGWALASSNIRSLLSPTWGFSPLKPKRRRTEYLDCRVLWSHFHAEFAASVFRLRIAYTFQDGPAATRSSFDMFESDRQIILDSVSVKVQ